MLGPDLFLMYTNNVAEGVASQLRSLLTTLVFNVNHVTLDSDLNKHLSWAKTWPMDFNVSKCAEHMITSWSQHIPGTDNQDYLGYH